MDAWIHSWKTYQNRVNESSIAQMIPLNKKRLKAHPLLKKAESALKAQIRTGEIDPADFLHKRHVPGKTFPACPCDWHIQTPEHVINVLQTYQLQKGQCEHENLSKTPQITNSLAHEIRHTDSNFLSL